MGVRLPSVALPPTDWATINLGGGQSFEIAIRRPTLPEITEQLSIATEEDAKLFRLKTSITDWRGGIEDEHGQPVPYSWDALGRLLTLYPQAVGRVYAEVNEVWFTLPGDLAKNWQTPPASGGTPTTDATTDTTESSNSPSTSSDASDSGPLSGT